MARTGRYRRGRQCWLRWAPLPPDHDVVPYIGYAVGRSVGAAVIRNRIRRRLRAALRTQSELQPGLYLIGVTDASAATSPFEHLCDELRDLVAKTSPSGLGSDFEHTDYV